MRTAGRRGTTVRRGEGRWLIQATAANGTKQSRVVRVDGRERKDKDGRWVVPLEVQRELNALVARVDVTKRAEETGALFRQIVAQWLDKAELAPSTRYHYESKLNLYILPRFGERPVDQIRVVELDDFYLELRQRGFKPATVRQIHAIIRSALKKAVVWGSCDYNVATMVDLPGAGTLAQQEIEAPTTEEVAALMALARETDQEMYALIVVSAAIGSRPGETLALRWRDVDLTAGSIRVAGAIDGTPGQDLAVKGTKTHATATIAVGPQVVAAIEAYRSWCDDRAAEWNADALRRWAEPGDRRAEVTDASFLWCRDPFGTMPWFPTTATHRMAALRAKAGLSSHVKLKNLRHFHATQLLSAGADIRTVAGRLRHASPSTTLNFYAKRDLKKDRQAADQFDTTLFG